MSLQKWNLLFSRLLVQWCAQMCNSTVLLSSVYSSWYATQYSQAWSSQRCPFIRFISSECTIRALFRELPNSFAWLMSSYYNESNYFHCFTHGRYHSGMIETLRIVITRIETKCNSPHYEPFQKWLSSFYKLVCYSKTFLSNLSVSRTDSITCKITAY